ITVSILPPMKTTKTRSLRFLSGLAIGVTTLSLAACGSSSGSSAKPADKTSSTTASTAPVDLRLGYFPNVTHAPALIGLQGKIFASPQLGNTQDIALRSWLKKQGYSTDTSGGGDVSIVPEDNALTLTAFQQGQIDGAWVPEPWATRLVKEGGGKILVDEASL